MTYPNPANLTTANLFAQYLNTVTDGWFWAGILFSLYAIILISLAYTHPKEEAMAAAGFICMILAILMKVMSIVTDSIMFLFGLLAIAGIALLWAKSGS